MADPTTTEYQAARDQILDALMAALQQAAIDNDSEITNIMVVFLSGNSSRRRKRDTSAQAELDITMKKIIRKIEQEVTDDDLQVLYSQNHP